MTVKNLVLAFGGVLLIAACGGKSSDIPPIDEPLPAVRASLGTAELIELPESIELVGSLVSARTSSVSARVMATITAMHVEAGDRVKRGAVLLEIDPAAARGQMAQASGALAQARSALPLAERNAARFQALLADEAASQLEVDTAEMQLAQAQGAIEQAEGALAAAGSLAADTRVVAPFAGRVVRRLAEVGDLAAPGRPLIELETEGGFRLAIAVPETAMRQAALAMGNTVPVHLDAWSHVGELTGTVVKIVPSANPASHAFQIEILLPEEATSSLGLSTGASGRAHVEVGRRAAIVIPASAVVRYGGLEMVVLRGEDGTTETRAVTLGQELRPDGSDDARIDDARIEVLSGLKGGETVLLGLGALPPTGSPVEVTS